MKYLFVVLSFIATLSCNVEDQPEQSLLKSSTKIIVDNDLYFNAPDDANQIINAVVKDDFLNITLQYGGGCGNIYYDLVSTDEYLATEPVQKKLRLAFKDDDNCEAGMEVTLSFNIKEIQRPQENTIILNLQGWEKPLAYIY